MTAEGDSAGTGPTAFVFAGGGSFGAVQVGMLRALARHGVVPDMVVGSSVGALNAAYFAGRPNVDGVRALETVWRGLKRQDVFPITWWTLLAFARRGDFLVSSEGLRNLCLEHLPYRDLADAEIPVHVVATDMLSGDAVVLSRGPAIDAIVASAAIPAAFAPVVIDRKHLVDGAVTCNTPVKVAVACGARRLIVLPTGYACALEKPPRGAVASALHALTLLIARQLLHEIDGLGHEIACHIVPPLCPLAGSPYDFSHTQSLIERAADSTENWIAAGGLERCDVPHTMKAHKHH